MAVTESTMLPLGTLAPDFSLPDAVTGGTVALADFNDAKVLVVAFLCNHCPYVKHIRSALADLARSYEGKGVRFVAISSNDVESHPDDSPDKMAAEAREAGYIFPYLYDESQRIAKAYNAACTPDFFVFDADRALVYRGQFDDTRPGSSAPATGADLRAAIDAALAGAGPIEPQKPSMGCNIKWKSRSAPDYFTV